MIVSLPYYTRDLFLQNSEWYVMSDWVGVRACGHYDSNLLMVTRGVLLQQGDASAAAVSGADGA